MKKVAGFLHGLYKRRWQLGGGTVYFTRDPFFLIVGSLAFAAAIGRMLMPGGRAGASSPNWQHQSKPLAFVSPPSLAIVRAINPNFILPLPFQEGAVSRITLAASHRP